MTTIIWRGRKRVLNAINRFIVLCARTAVFDNDGQLVLHVVREDPAREEFLTATLRENTDRIMATMYGYQEGRDYTTEAITSEDKPKL